MRIHFFVLLSGILLNLSGAEKIFEWGHDGLNAKVAGEIRKPKAVVNVTLEEGGIRLGHFSQIRFDVSKLPTLKGYTLVFHGKIKFDVQGNNTWYDRDRLDDGKLSTIIRGGARSLIPYGPLQNRFYASNWNWMVHFNRWFEKDEWHWFALGYDAKCGLKMYQLDNRVQYFHEKKVPEIKLGKELCFGSKNPKSKDPRDYGVDMVIGELALYDKMLSKKELLSLYGRIRGVEAELKDYAVIAGKNETLHFQFRNYSDKTWDNPIAVKFIDGQGKEIAKDNISLKLQAGKDAFKTIEFKAPNPGIYRIKFDTGRSFELLALDSRPFTADMKPGELELKLLEEIDCTKPLPGRFISDGKDTIVKDKSGTYRESGTAERSAFAYKLKKLANPNRYHVLEIEYPDNAKRAYAVNIWAEFFGRITSGQLNALGIITGGQHPVSYTMRKRSLLWLPYAEQNYVVLDNYRQDVCERGAALSRLRIYEVQNEKLPLLQTAKNGRGEISVIDEDMGMDNDWINMPHQFERIDLHFWQEKAERMAEYSRYMGYNQKTYQIADYHGDRDAGHMNVTPGTPTAHLHGWGDVWAKIFEREQMHFWLRLAMGWFYPKSAGSVPMFSDPKTYSNSLAEHFSRGTDCPAEINRNGKVFGLNPLHPKTEEECRKFIAYYRDRYAKYKYFKGLTLHDNIQFFNGLETGYGNWNIDCFEKDTGINVPSSPDPKKCIELRYRFLTSPKIKNKWIQWRCNRYARFLKNLTEELRKDNPHLEYQVWIRFESSLRDTTNRNLKIRQCLLEAGFDMDQLNKIEGLRIMPLVRPEFEHIRPLLKQQETYAMFDQSFAEAFAGQKNPGLIYSLWTTLECYRPEKFSLKNFFVPVGNWNWIKNDSHAFSWASCWPVDDFALLLLTNMLANMDLEHISTGWWGHPDCGVNQLLRPFWQAFRSIPQGKYELKSDPDSPVALRVCGNNFYLVNKENFPVEISLTHSGLEDVVSGKPFKAEQFTMKPCEVRVFSGKINSFKQNVNPDAPVILKKQIANFETTVKIIGDPKIEKLLNETKEYFRQGKFTKARQMFYLHEIIKVLAENKGLQLTAKLLPKEVAVEVNVISFDQETRNISVWIDKADGCWNADSENKVNLVLKSGERKAFRIKLKDALVKDGWNGTITLFMTVDNGIPMQKKFLLGGHFARYSDIAEIGKDWSFSKYKMKISEVKDKLGRKIFDYSQGYAWNERGLFIATVVDDTDYLPADDYHRHFQSDSMQYFIDGKNLSVYDAEAYNDSVMELIAAEEKGQFKIIHCQIPKHGVTAQNSKIRMAFHREHGKSYWELFIPTNELPDVQFKKGYVLGVCAMINNRMKKKSGGESFMTNQKIFPYLKPGTWQDLILTDENGQL